MFLLITFDLVEIDCAIEIRNKIIRDKNNFFTINQTNQYDTTS